MEMFLKCLLKWRPDVGICQPILTILLKITKLSPYIGHKLALLYVHCCKVNHEEFKRMYRNARLFIAYDGALEGGRDQDWWFEACRSRWAETADYWAGNIPPRVSYCMALDSPLEYPNAYVKWKVLETVFTVYSHLKLHRYWVAATLVMALIALGG